MCVVFPMLSSVFAKEPMPERWITVRPTPIYIALPLQENEPDGWIPGRCIAVVRWDQVRTLANGSTYRFVEFPTVEPFLAISLGWVEIKDIQPVNATLRSNKKANDELQIKTFSELLNKAISDENDRKDLQERFGAALQKERKKINSLTSGRTFPDLIRIVDDELREAFVLAQTAYVENRLLPPEKQRFEPYLTRAKAWAKAGYYPEAMFDYLDGLEIIKRLPVIDGQPENAFLLYRKHIDEMTSTVRTALSQPFAVVAMGRGASHTAGRHFSNGYTKFWDAESGNKDSKLYTEALFEFGNAISIEFYVPAYWYYRGLAYKRLGQQNQAIYCFLLASQMEKMTVDEKGKDKEWEQIYFAHLNSSISLTRFQGKERIWLETIRWGDPSNQLLKGFDGDIVPNR